MPDKWHATTGYTAAMPSVDPVMRRALRARAHHLHPVVAVGQHGLTPAVLREIDRALKAHELIKVRVFSDDRQARTALLDEICAALGAEPVQHLGKLLVLWRAEPESEDVPSKPAARGARGAAGQSSPGRGVTTDRARRPHRGAPKAASRQHAQGVQAKGPAAHGSAGDTVKGPGSRQAFGTAASAGRTRGNPANPRAPRGVPRAAMPRRRRGTGGTG